MAADIYFRADDSNRYLPWLIGIMATLATLLLCLGLTLSGWIVDTGSGYNRSFTVNVPARTATAENTQQVEQILSQHPMVAQVSRLSESDLAAVLKPWLGAQADASQLPLPVVFDVALNSEESEMDYAALSEQLAKVAPGVEIDAHERWVEAFSRFSAMAQTLLIALSLVLLAAMGLMIAFTSRASLKLHSRTVQLLHSVGAEDGYITRQFQYEAGRLALMGASAGSVLAGLVYLGVGQYMASLPSSSLPHLTLSARHLTLVALLPAGCALIAWFVARWSVRRQLSKSM